MRGAAARLRREGEDRFLLAYRVAELSRAKVLEPPGVYLDRMRPQAPVSILTRLRGMVAKGVPMTMTVLRR